MLDDKSMEIIYQLIKRNNQSLIELSDNLKLTKRQITYSLEKTNYWLEMNNVPEISFSRQGGYHIGNKAKVFMLKQINTSRLPKVYMLNSLERQNYIYLMLFIGNEFISLNHLIVELKMSRSTVLSDLKELKDKLAKKNIQLHYNRELGYFLAGQEETIRYQMMYMVMEILNEENGLTILNQIITSNNLKAFSKIGEQIRITLHECQIEMIENKIKEFTYCYIFILPRLHMDYKPRQHDASYQFISQLKEFEFSQKILANENIHNKENIYYIAGWLLGLSIGDMSDNTSDQVYISELVDKTIYRFQALSGTKISQVSEIRKQIYQHFRPAYYRLFFKLPIINPLEDKIQTEYQEMYRLVSKTIEPLNYLFEEQIPESEIAFLTIHFASVFVQEPSMAIQKRKAVVICPNGLGSSVILSKELQNLLPELEFRGVQDYRHYLASPVEADIVFSTIHLTELNDSQVPVIVVSPIMSSKEKSRVISDVYGAFGENIFVDDTFKLVMEIIDKYVPENLHYAAKEDLNKALIKPEIITEIEGEDPLLSEIVNEQLIQINLAANNWEEAIRQAAYPLLEQNYITQNCIEEMIQTTKEIGPYIVITKHVALPHARPEAGAKKIGISIATLQAPVVFGNKDNDPVKYIFCLSAKDNKTHLNAMSELVELLDKSEFYHVLDTAKSPQVIYEYIKRYEGRGE